MSERDLAPDRIERWRRQASALPGRSWSKSVLDNIRAGARVREDLHEKGLAAARRVLAEFRIGSAKQQSGGTS